MPEALPTTCCVRTSQIVPGNPASVTGPVLHGKVRAQVLALFSRGVRGEGLLENSRCRSEEALTQKPKPHPEALRLCRFFGGVLSGLGQGAEPAASCCGLGVGGSSCSHPTAQPCPTCRAYSGAASSQHLLLLSSSPTRLKSHLLTPLFPLPTCLLYFSANHFEQALVGGGREAILCRLPH